MPINSSPLENTEYRSYQLEITDEDELAKCVALLAVGHFRHVQKILDRLSPPGTFFPTGAVTKAIDEFSKTGTGHLENRDGWIFQFMSWIALAARTRGAILLDAPHPMPSQKGFDGLAVSLSSDPDQVDFVLITEDKATDNPRQFFRNEVLPEMRDIEAGSRDGEMLARVTTQVERAVSDEESREKMLQESLWNKDLRFRVCIATSGKQLPARIDLFKGFKESASGPSKRRGGELLNNENLRLTLQSLATKIVQYLRSKEKSELSTDV